MREISLLRQAAIDREKLHGDFELEKRRLALFGRAFDVVGEMVAEAEAAIEHAQAQLAEGADAGPLGAEYRKVHTCIGEIEATLGELAYAEGWLDRVANQPWGDEAFVQAARQKVRERAKEGVLALKTEIGTQLGQADEAYAAWARSRREHEEKRSVEAARAWAELYDRYGEAVRRFRDVEFEARQHAVASAAKIESLLAQAALSLEKGRESDTANALAAANTMIEDLDGEIAAERESYARRVGEVNALVADIRGTIDEQMEALEGNAQLVMDMQMRLHDFAAQLDAWDAANDPGSGSLKRIRDSISTTVAGYWAQRKVAHAYDAVMTGSRGVTWHRDPADAFLELRPGGTVSLDGTARDGSELDVEFSLDKDGKLSMNAEDGVDVDSEACAVMARIHRELSSIFGDTPLYDDDRVLDYEALCREDTGMTWEDGEDFARKSAHFRERQAARPLS